MTESPAVTPSLVPPQWLEVLPANLLELASGWSTPVICVAAIIHFFAYLSLVAWASRDLRQMASDLDAFTRGLKNRSVLGPVPALTDQIDGFLADVKDVLDQPSGSADRKTLLTRIQVLDEQRRYFQSQSFETMATVCRNMIEAYPLAGVLGTILAIGAALQVDSSKAGAGTVQAIVQYFGDAIWSTFAGLVAAVMLMFFASIVETKFRRLGENRTAIRDTVHRVKRELVLGSAEAQS